MVGHVAWAKERDLLGEVEGQYKGNMGGDVDWIVIGVMDSGTVKFAILWIVMRYSQVERYRHRDCRFL